jgi:hypothetical protein
MDPMDELAELLGEKLPPRLSTPPTDTPMEKEQKNVIDSFGKLQTFDDFLSQQDFPAPLAPENHNRRNGTTVCESSTWTWKSVS